MNFSDLKAAHVAGALGKPAFIEQALALHSRLFDYVGVVRATDVREIRIDAEGVSFVLGDEAIRLFCPPGEARVAPIEVMNFDRYEPQETAVMDALSRDARVVLDVGANIGWYAVRFAKRLPRAAIHAFEPMPQSHAYLQRNVAANGVGDRVRVYSHGLSDASGSVPFYVAPAGGTNASLANVAASDAAVPVIGLTLTLDQWVHNQGIAPDFIKCDVEGAELLVFRGGEQTLRRHRPVVFAELLRKWSKPFGYHPNDMLAFFRGMGYDAVAVGSCGVRRIELVDDETPETNYAFLHREAHEALFRRLELQA